MKNAAFIALGILLSFSATTVQAEVEKYKNLSNCQIQLNKSHLTPNALCGGGSSGGGGGNSGGGNTQVFSTNTLRVECESYAYNLEECTLPTGYTNVKINKTYSDASCDGNWFVSGNTLSVKNGCRARFDITMNRTVKVFEFQCKSNQLANENCFYFRNQQSEPWVNDRFSTNYCHKYNNWAEIPNSEGINVWVDGGCRAKFNVLID